MVRDILGFLAGMAVGSAVNVALIFMSWQIWPLPEGIDINDAAQLAAYIQGLPAAAFLLVMLAHLGQAFVGGWLGARIAEHPMTLAMIIGGLTMIGGLMNMVALPGPVWMWAEMPLYLGLAYLAGRMETRRRDGLTPA